MFDVFREPGRQLILFFGKTVEYISASSGSHFVPCLIEQQDDDKNSLKLRFKLIKKLAYIHSDDLETCEEKDLLKYSGITYEIRAPYLDDDGTWNINLVEKTDE